MDEKIKADIADIRQLIVSIQKTQMKYEVDQTKTNELLNEIIQILEDLFQQLQKELSETEPDNDIALLLERIEMLETVQEEHNILLQNLSR